MKKKYLLLLIFPVLFFILSVSIRFAQGPYFFNVRYDPTYPYLINSLNIAQGYTPELVVHPGTPVQIVGAIVINLNYALTKTNESVSENVLNNPENYIFQIDLVFIFLNAIALFVMGMIIFNCTQNYYLSFLFQLTPFVYYTLFRRLTHVSPENLMLFSTILLIAFVFKFSQEKDLSSKKIFNYVLIFGILGGLGLAIKLSFLPLVLIPLFLIPGIKKKFLFSVFTCISFIIFVIPAIPKTGYFFNEWIAKNIIGSSGKYGSETKSLIDSSSYFNQIMQIFKDEPILSVTYFFIAVVLVLWLFKRKKYVQANRIELITLIAIFISMTLQILIVAKRYNPQYIMPALMICIPGIYFGVVNLMQIVNIKFSIRHIVKASFVILLGISVLYCYRYYRMCVYERNETLKLYQFIDAYYPEAVKVTSFGASSIDYAYGYATQQIYAGSQTKNYKSISSRRYPESVFIEGWTKNIYSLNESFDIKKFLLSGKVVIFLNREEVLKPKLIKNLKEQYNITASFLKVYTNKNGESVYELSLK